MLDKTGTISEHKYEIIEPNWTINNVIISYSLQTAQMKSNFFTFTIYVYKHLMQTLHSCVEADSRVKNVEQV